MTDRELVKSILTYCKGECWVTIDDFIDNGYVIFNDQGQCMYLNLKGEGLTEIPSELLELKHLNHLDLRDNDIKTIPKSLHDSIHKIYIDDKVIIVDDTIPQLLDKITKCKVDISTLKAKLIDKITKL